MFWYRVGELNRTKRKNVGLGPGIDGTGSTRLAHCGNPSDLPAPENLARLQITLPFLQSTQSGGGGSFFGSSHAETGSDFTYAPSESLCLRAGGGISKF